MKPVKNVRNFWVEIDVNGVKTAAGPLGANGQFTATVYQRNGRKVTTALHIEGRVFPDGTLQTEARLDERYWSGEEALIAVSQRDAKPAADGAK